LTSIFNKLFARKTHAVSADAETPTIPITEIPPSTAPTEVRENIELDLPQLSIGCAQSMGMQRDHNEDSLLAINTLLSGNGTYIPFGLYIVADGMGGHKHGEIASGLAVRIVASQVINKVFLTLLKPEPTSPSDSIQEILESGLQEAHRLVIKEAPGSGTTLTAVMVLNKQMTIAHVGDSRLYAISPDGEVSLITRDHSLVMRMIELGQLSEKDAAIHPQRNVLYRALGQGEVFSPDIITSSLPDSGSLLLCSDGLWGVVPQAEVARLIKANQDPQVAAQLLVDAANAAGGPDNITAILIRLPD
jgi:serine/threonine protein phosphatase PrpC